jgi:hypothetical protein
MHYYTRQVHRKPKVTQDPYVREPKISKTRKHVSLAESLNLITISKQHTSPAHVSQENNFSFFVQVNSHPSHQSVKLLFLPLLALPACTVENTTHVYITRQEQADYAAIATSSGWIHETGSIDSIIRQFCIDLLPLRDLEFPAWEDEGQREAGLWRARECPSFPSHRRSPPAACWRYPARN